MLRCGVARLYQDYVEGKVQIVLWVFTAKKLGCTPCAPPFLPFLNSKVKGAVLQIERDIILNIQRKTVFMETKKALEMMQWSICRNQKPGILISKTSTDTSSSS